MQNAPRLVFSQGFESLFHPEFCKGVTPAMKEEFKAIGLDIDRKLLPGYPVETWAKTLEICAKHLYPSLPYEDAALELGRGAIDGFMHTIGGKAAFFAMRLIGVARSIERAARTYAVTSNYQQVKLTRLSATSFDFYLNENVAPPEFDMGIVGRTLEELGAKNSTVTLVSRDAEGFTMRLTWDP